jgi:histidyl-tRNA synthetase
MARVEARVLKGFRDYLPEVEGPRQRMLATVKGVFESFGYGALQTPALEYSDILLGKYGDEGDKLLYRFMDNGERDVAMRYDLTVPLARVIGMYQDLVMPWRRYQVAPVWRAEKPGKGRFREFMQCDADLVGEPSVRADAEIMMVGLGVLAALEVPSFVMRVNDRRILDGVLDTVGVEGRDARMSVLRAIDKLPKIGPDEVRAEIRAGVGLGDEAITRLFGLLGREIGGREDLAALREELVGSEVGLAGIAGLSELLAILEGAGLGAQVAVDLSIARGLDYYTSTIYETFLVGHEAYGSVMSGGRYDTLMDMFSGKATPAVGISLGVDRLLAALLDLGLVKARKASADAFFCMFSNEDYAAVAGLARTLRAAGVKVEVALSAGKLGKQFQLATKKGYRWALLQGADERARGELVLKDLESGTQEVVAVAAVETWGPRLTG